MNRYIDFMNSEFPLSMSLYSEDKVIHNVGSYEFTLSVVANIPPTEIARYTRVEYHLVVLHNGKPSLSLRFGSVDKLLIYLQEFAKAETHKNTLESDFHPSIRFHSWNKDE